MRKDVFWWTYSVYQCCYTAYMCSETAKRINEMKWKEKEEPLVRIVVRSHLHLQLLRVFLYKRDFSLNEMKIHYKLF